MPKTGGTSFTRILERNFGGRYEPFEGLWASVMPKITLGQMETFVHHFPGISAVSSHQFSVFLPYESASRRVVAIAFVRNPVERFFSFYFHMRHKYGVKHISKELSLEEYIDFMAKKEKCPPGSMLSFLTGSRIDNAYDYEMVESLVKRKLLYLLPTDRMQESIELLKSDFPDDFKRVELVTENVSKKDFPITDVLREEVRAMVSPFCFRLMELANNLLDKKWK